MEPYRASVRAYIEASKRLLQSDALSPEERQTIRDYLDAIDRFIADSEAPDSTESEPDS